MKTILKKVLIIFIHVLLINYSQSNRLVYNKNHSTITLFTQSQQPIQMDIDFQTNSIHFSSAMEDRLQSFYLTKHAKNKISIKQNIEDADDIQELNKNIFFDFQTYQKTFKDFKKSKIQGKIGLKPYENTFLSLIKNSNDQSEIEIKINPFTQQMNILFQECSNSIQFPLNLKIKGKKEVYTQVSHLQNDFVPHQKFIKQVLGVENGKRFELSQKQMSQGLIKLQINRRIKNIRLKDLLSQICHYKPSSNSYQCRIRQSNNKHSANNQQENYSGLLMFFDLSICQNGIQIQSDLIQAQQEYYVIHYLLIVLTLIAGIVYTNDENVFKLIKKILSKKKRY